MRFCRLILNRGVLDGVRLLGRKTVDLMLMNHLPGDLAAMGQPRFAESSYAGIGFGGEGHTTFTIAGPTGEGITSARSFTRQRRCVMADSFHII